MPALYLLFETASGYSLLETKGLDELGTASAQVQQSVNDLARFSKIVNLVAFKPFKSAIEALEQVNAVAEGVATQELQNFLEANLPQVKKGQDPKKAKFHVGVYDSKLGSAIQETQGSQLGLAHSYSRAKVKFNVNRVDNMVIQAIALLDTLDRDINTFVMRVREWYSWHFPELVKVVPDNYQYARLTLLIQDKSSLSGGPLPGMVDVLGDEEKAQEVVDAAKTSMGQDISPLDLVNIATFAKRVIALAEYRVKLQTYLHDKMHAIAPNLSALIGEVVGARLISHAGSLTNLAKCPASTVQILGAEKALFRALKTRGNTPKYGLIYHSTFIGRAKQRNKGRISRYLANKCSIASRIDCFREAQTSAFGESMRNQVEERLRFYDEGVAPSKNADAMQAVMAALPGTVVAAAAADAAGAPKKKRKKAEQAAAGEVAPVAVPDPDPEAAEPKSKKKKKKAQAQEDSLAAAAATLATAATAATDASLPKKKKKAAAAVAAAAAEVAAAVSTEEPAKKKKKKAKA
ncbi:hypothetical protein WJX73_007724 [Symbiochloris irregularis]|uniref:Nucleolar protein 56 n=1 Tax=Symbiochloris irregularis TaxID=706552 RepID=A0AAW1P8D6_9CHLO